MIRQAIGSIEAGRSTEVDRRVMSNDQETDGRKTKRGRPKQESLKVDTKWFDNLVRTRFPTQAAMNRTMKMHPSVYSRGKGGKRSFSILHLIALHETFRIPLNELLHRMGYKVPRQGVRVIGKITGDSKASTVSARRGDTAVIGDFPSGARAYLAETQKSILAAYHGAAFVCQETDSVPAEAFGRLCVVGADEHLLPILGTIDKALGRQPMTLTVFGTSERIPVQKLHSVSIVVAIVFPPFSLDT